MEKIQAELSEMRGQMGQFMGNMQAIIQDQRMLREEVNQMKTQMSLLMEVVKGVLKKDDSPMLKDTLGIVVSPLPVESIPEYNVSHGFVARSTVQELPRQQPSPVSQEKPRIKRYSPELKKADKVLEYLPQQQNNNANRYRNNHNQYPGGRQGQYQGRKRKAERCFDRPPISYAQLLQLLLHSRLVELRTVDPPKGELPLSYDANAHCDFHSGAPGHNVECCKAFQHKVQDLIDLKEIEFTSSGVSIHKSPPLTTERERDVPIVSLKAASSQGNPLQ